MAVVSIRTKNHHLWSVDISNYLIILYYSFSITFFKILIDYRQSGPKVEIVKDN